MSIEHAATPRSVSRYVATLTALGLVAVLAAAAIQLTISRAMPSTLDVAGAVVFVACFFVLGQTSFTFTWRGHRHRMVLDEVALFVGLVAIPPAIVLVLVAFAGLLEQARMRRERMKAAFNVSSNVLAATVATSVFILLAAAGAPPILAAMPGALLYPLASNFLISGIFSRLTESSQLALFQERFMGPSLVAGSVGAGGGIAVATLWTAHPLTLLSLVPFVFLTYRYGILTALADRELAVHKRLAEVAHELVGTTDLEGAARHILQACGDAFPGAARAELVLHDHDAPIVESFVADTEVARGGALEAPVPGNPRVSAPGEDGAIGVLRLYRRRTASAVTEVEEALIRIVAAQLGAAIEEARALSLEESARQRMETYLGSAPDAILLVRDGVIRYANPAAATLLGVDGASAVPIARIVPHAATLLRPDTEDRLVETTAVDVRGEREMTVEISARDVPGGEGTVLLVRDVTERNRLEEESRHQRDVIMRQEKLSALGTLVAGVAHEINNPVTYMRGALELASLDLEEVEAEASTSSKSSVQHARASLAKLAQGVDRVERITHALKAVARQGNGERSLEDVRDVVDDVVQVVEVALPQGVRVVRALDKDVPSVRANASELHQVVLNLVKNAVEALAAANGGTIMVAARRADAGDSRGVVIEVRDDGPGIPDDVQRRLFEPFFTTKRRGTGLGLSLSKGIVEAHGGELRLASVVGSGTTFTLWLPAAHPEAAPEARASSAT